MELQAFLITFREALEAILIVGVILTYLTRIGQVRYHKWVWLGVFLAILASYLSGACFSGCVHGLWQYGQSKLSENRNHVSIHRASNPYDLIHDQAEQ